MPHLQRALGRLPDHGERLRRQIVDLGTFLQATPKLVRLGPQAFVAQRLDLRLELVGGPHGPPKAPDQPFVAAAEDTREKLQQADSPDRKI